MAVELENDSKQTKKIKNKVVVKVGILGDAKCGQTELMMKYIEDKYDEDYTETLGVNFMEKTFPLKNVNVTISIWDLGGQTEFDTLIPLVCSEAKVIIFAFDLTQKQSLFSVKRWYKEARKENKIFMPFLVGTRFELFNNLEDQYKLDIAKQARTFAQKMHSPLVYCSSAQSINVKKIFKIIIAKVFDLKPKIKEAHDPLKDALIEFEQPMAEEDVNSSQKSEMKANKKENSKKAKPTKGKKMKNKKRKKQNILEKAKTFIKPPIDYIVLCQNGIYDMNVSASNKQKSFDQRLGAYAGDVRKIDSIGKHKDFVQIKKHNIKFFDNDLKSPQILYINHPLPMETNYNYLHKIQKSFDKTKTSLSQIVNDNMMLMIADEIITEIVSFLPIKFPIFISCATIYRTDGSFTHFTYPYAVEKYTILHHLQKCQNLFDSLTNCYYCLEIYLIKDDHSKQCNQEDYDIAFDEQVIIPFPYDTETLYHKYNEPMLIAQKEGEKLKDIMELNNVGGSLWIDTMWNNNNIKDDCDIIDEAILKKQTITNRIGGTGGVASRNWYQTNLDISHKYLPMTILNVCCSADNV